MCAQTLKSELSAEELELLTHTIKNAGLKGRHLEIGTAAGGTLCRMMNCFCDKDRPPFVVVDPMTYFEGQERTVRMNLMQNGLKPEDVDIRVQRSNEAFREAAGAGETYDFIFIDASHKIKYVTQDLCWTRLLNVGGFACFHDYGKKIRGVALPIDRFCKRHQNYSKYARVGSLLVLKKNGRSASPEITGIDHLYARIMAPLIQLETSVKKRLKKWFSK